VRRIEFFVKETLQALRRNGLLVFAAISTAFIALFLLGGALLVQREVNLIAAQTEANVEVSVFLSDTISASQTQNLNEMISAMPQTASVHYESKDEAYQRFKVIFANQPPLVDNVSPDALPASFRVKLKDPQQFLAVAEQLQGQPGIDKIVDNADLYKRLFAVTRIFRIGVFAVALVMLVASAALIGNTVRMAVFARRHAIGIMRLVGATNGTIRVPFLLEGLVEGLLGAGAAVIGLFIMKAAFIDPLKGNIGFLPLISTKDIIFTVLWIVPAAVVVAVVAGFFATRRFLDV
jgi:cell division transport system permease protein